MQLIFPTHLFVLHSTADFANEILDADKVLNAFFVECHKAGPTTCAFYANSSAAIAHNLDVLYEKVLAQPVPAYSPDLPKYGFVDHPTLKNAILSSFYQPYSLFSTLAQGFALLEHCVSIILAPCRRGCPGCCMWRRSEGYRRYPPAEDICQQYW